MFSLYFDIGNTNIKIGLRPKNGSITTYVLPSDKKSTADQFGLSLLSVLQVAQCDPAAIYFCMASSVVPALSQVVADACKRFIGVQVCFVPEDISVPLENRYARPYEVGADRLVGSFGARSLFPDVHSIIIVDFGTATTFDCVEGNAFLGGLICPGVFSSAAALASGTAKLPSIDLHVTEPSVSPGISTTTSLNHGFVFGFAAMTEGLLQQLSVKMKKDIMVIGTGGFASALSKVTTCFDAVRSGLVLEGLACLDDIREPQEGTIRRK